MEARDREAAFDAWLHDAGYTYTGDDTLYALTLPEMARLKRGYKKLREDAEDSAGQRGGRPAEVTDGDLKAVREFEDRHLN